MKKFFLYFSFFLVIFFIFSGCVTQSNSSSKSTLENLKKDALEVNIAQTKEEESKITQNDSPLNKYQQLQPNNSEEEFSLDNITINFTNNSEYVEEDDFKIKPVEFIISGYISLDPTNAKKDSPICKIEVKPMIIQKGQEASVIIYANSFNQNVYYSCSDKIKLAGSNGIFRKESICKFDEEGLLKQKIFFDDVECASSPVYVAKNLNDFYCAVFDQNKSQDLFGNYNYFAKLFVFNFNSSDEIVLSCGNFTVKKRIYDELLTSNFGVFDFGCYNLTSTTPINLEIRGKPCKFFD
ncbi:MAG: hypothetical protein QXG16_01165 [Candidatus Anstonellaceae archaeon]